VLPGSKYARIVMIAVTVVIIAGLVISAFLYPMAF
jgi:hypothetical protein